MTVEQLTALANQRYDMIRMAEDLARGARAVLRSGADGAALVSYRMTEARRELLVAIRRIDRALEGSDALAAHEAAFGPAPW
jgi:hypothetical protein